MNVTRRFRPNPSTASGLLLLAACALTAFRSSPAAAADGLVFLGPDNGEYQFDTGILKGVLHRGGRSTGLLPVSDVASGKVLTKSMGWLSPYRTLSTGTQHGYGAWDWASETRLLPDGAVEVRWLANDTYPLNMTAVYRWSAANTADLEMAVTPQKDLPQLEIFVASYFEGFTQAFVYAQDAATGQAKFVPALKEDAVWHVFPRDGEVAKLVGDGRWQHPPAPVTWTVRNPLAAPLAIRRNPELGLTALLMSPPEDCFAVYTPYGEEGHGSLYLGLLGCDVKAGQTATGRARLVIGHTVSDEQAVNLFQDYVQTLSRR
ncbi:MAG: hypothetical protein MUF25_12395 [Pirellulaceae bacterium]|nr:hypothetical protein [Pirellulaceae bacterium]